MSNWESHSVSARRQSTKEMLTVSTWCPVSPPHSELDTTLRNRTDIARCTCYYCNATVVQWQWTVVVFTCLPIQQDTVLALSHWALSPSADDHCQKLSFPKRTICLPEYILTMSVKWTASREWTGRRKRQKCVWQWKESSASESAQRQVQQHS